VNPDPDTHLTNSIHQAFQDLDDPRANNRIHPLINVVFTALVAVIAGANTNNSQSEKQ
jgi:vacuolar-type H+-ATPase catalytic subunit A/Vma1